MNATSKFSKTSSSGRFGHHLRKAAFFVSFAAVLTATSAMSAPLQFAGTGDAVTPPFTTNAPWTVKWAADGRRFEAVLVDPDGVESQVANLIEPGAGATHYFRAGTYFFKVRAWGPWSLTVTETLQDGPDQGK